MQSFLSEIFLYGLRPSKVVGEVPIFFEISSLMYNYSTCILTYFHRNSSLCSRSLNNVWSFYDLSLDKNVHKDEE